ncbi:hypothetical protein BD626DRAFT_625825 [Schizophyllum amplum]|uniref:Uncharacterized protein n=1 Tax=Schizophyllum amplum TaxID=97359 RepID=A0A550CRF9_9AGAR|nr:hypothetical protein BD626DRAFT_625825 [Auriculariopsis ampla]
MPCLSLPCRRGRRRRRRASALRDGNRRGMGGAERRHHYASPVVDLDVYFATRVGMGMWFEVPLRRCVDIMDRGEHRAWLWPRTRRRRAVPSSPYFILWIKWYGLGDGAGDYDAAGRGRRPRGRRPRMGRRAAPPFSFVRVIWCRRRRCTPRGEGDARAAGGRASRGGAARRHSSRLGWRDLADWVGGRDLVGRGRDRAAGGRVCDEYMYRLPASEAMCICIDVRRAGAIIL